MMQVLFIAYLKERIQEDNGLLLDLIGPTERAIG